MLGVTYHGGFKIGDVVDFKEHHGWSTKVRWIIQEFEGRNVKLKCEKCSATRTASLDEVRHSHLVKTNS